MTATSTRRGAESPFAGILRLPDSVQPNGIRVIEGVPGLFETIKGRYLDEFNFYSVIPEDMSVLAELQHPKKMREATGRGSFGIRRSDLQKAMVAHAEKLGVEFKWSHKLEKLDQTEDSVTVTFANGAQETFSFVVGCDGLHSNTRICLFGEQPADYTGLVQVSFDQAAGPNLCLTIILHVGWRLWKCPGAFEGEG